MKKRRRIRRPGYGIKVKADTWSVAHRQWVVARQEQYLFKCVNIAHQFFAHSAVPNSYQRLNMHTAKQL